MRRRSLILCVLLLAGVAAAKAPDSLEELKARAAAASPSRQPLLYADIVQRDVELADKLFTDGDVERAHATVKDAVQYAEKCRDVLQSQPKKIKDTEIALRKAEHRLNEVRRTLALEDQADVQAAVDQIAAVRKQILDQMFAPKPKK